MRLRLISSILSNFTPIDQKLSSMITPAGYKTTKNNSVNISVERCAGTCLYCAISEGKVSATIFELWAPSGQLDCAAPVRKFLR